MKHVKRYINKFDATIFLEATFVARPTLKPGQWGQVRPGQVLEYAGFVYLLAVEKVVSQVFGYSSFCEKNFFQESLEVKAVFRISAQQGNNYRESTRKEQICKLKMVGISCKKQKQKQVFMNNGRS